jgi:ankyrin repeat protein
MSNKVKGLDGRWIILLLFVSLASPAAASSNLDLVEAVEKGATDTVRSLLEQRADVNAAQADGATALHWAAHRDDLESAELLIAASADLNAANDYGVTPLSLACTNGSAAMVAKLLKAGANPNAVQQTGETALMTASRTGNAEVVKSLLAYGADVNGRETRREQTALMWAVEQKRSEITRVLIEHGADVHAHSKRGFTPLLFAAQQGDLDSVRALLASGVDVNETSSEWGSALVAAAARGHEELSLFLLEEGADPNVADGFGISALHYTVLKGFAVFSSIPAHLGINAPYHRPSMMELVKALLAGGANPNAQTGKNLRIQGSIGSSRVSMVGSTPLVLASAAADDSLARLLIEGGADVGLATARNMTPLMAAAGLGHRTDRPTRQEYQSAMEVARLLVEEGADVNAVGENGWTALHGAAYIGSDGIVQLLVDNGARVDVIDDFEQTPWSIAEGLIGASLVFFSFKSEGIHPSTARLLLELGADPMFVPELPEQYSQLSR